MENKSPSLIIYGFVLIMVLYFIPTCVAARKLADMPQTNTVTEHHEHDDQSKGGVHGSEIGHAGSATGDSPPAGTVNMPPTPPFERIVNRNENGFQSVTTVGNGTGNRASNRGNGGQTTVYNGYGDQSVTTNDGDGNETIIHNSNGHQSVTTNDGNGGQTVVENNNYGNWNQPVQNGNGYQESYGPPPPACQGNPYFNSPPNGGCENSNYP